MTEYVCGFLFDDKDPKYVLLIEKSKPDWQRGLLNGIGGKIESGESSLQAMKREMQEEAGVTVEWSQFATLVYPDVRIYMFTAVDLRAMKMSRSLTEEKIRWFNTDELTTRRHAIIPNLSYLIPMAIHHCRDEFLIATVIGTPI